jgi:hypothetical protein
MCEQQLEREREPRDERRERERERGAGILGFVGPGRLALALGRGKEGGWHRATSRKSERAMPGEQERKADE